MRKIYIVGIVGSGKTTFAKELSKKLDIEHFEVDCIVWNKTELGRFERSYEEQVSVIEEIDKKMSWIIEGTHRPSCQKIIEKADVVVFLDPPLSLRKYRIIKRYIKQQMGLEHCHYKSDTKMLKAMFKWTREFEENRPKFEMMLKEKCSNLIVINNSSSLRTFRKSVT